MPKLIDSTEQLKPPTLEVQPAAAPQKGDEIPFAVIEGHVAVPMPIYNRMIHQIRLGETHMNILVALALDMDNREFAISLSDLAKARKAQYGLNVSKNPGAPEMIVRAITTSEAKKISKQEDSDNGKPVFEEEKKDV